RIADSFRKAGGVPRVVQPVVEIKEVYDRGLLVREIGRLQVRIEKVVEHACGRDSPVGIQRAVPAIAAGDVGIGPDVVALGDRVVYRDTDVRHRQPRILDALAAGADGDQRALAEVLLQGVVRVSRGMRYQLITEG